MTPNWVALRRLRRPYAIGLGAWLAFLALWQFLVPGKPSGSATLEMWLMLAAFAVLVPASLVLAGGATGHLWRARRRLAAVLPIALLCAITWALPTLADGAGLGPSIRLWMVPGALLLSTLASAAFVSFCASPGVPPSDRGMDGWTKPA